LFNNGDDSDGDANDSLLGYLSDISIKADNNNSKTKAGVAYNQALE
jgi:hypothetical protein